MQETIGYEEIFFVERSRSRFNIDLEVGPGL